MILFGDLFRSFGLSICIDLVYFKNYHEFICNCRISYEKEKSRGKTNRHWELSAGSGQLSYRFGAAGVESSWSNAPPPWLSRDKLFGT